MKERGTLQRRSFDRVWVGDGNFRTYVCFDPRWWQVWRWVEWFWRVVVRKEEHGTVTFHADGGRDAAGVKQTIERRVRTFYAAPPVRKRIEDQFRP